MYPGKAGGAEGITMDIGIGKSTSSPGRFRALAGYISILALAALLLLQMPGCGGGTASEATNSTPPPASYPDTVGTVVATQLPDCSSANGKPGGVCWGLTVTCPQVADIDAVVKVEDPSGPSIGTVTFTNGGGAEPLYENAFIHGTDAIDMVVAAGYTAAQIAFPNHPVGFPNGGNFAGWLTGPGGPRRLACRWVTAAKWVHDNIRAANTPLCTTGNSAGAAVVGYALAHYKQAALFTYVQETSGPPFTRIDHGCICTAAPVNTVCGQGALSECFDSNASRFVDPAYDPSPTSKNICSSAKSGDTTNQQLFFNDSLASSDAEFNFPTVEMHFLYGGLDTGSAEPESMEWQPLITANGPITNSCVADAPHLIADVLDGAQEVANDMIAFCK
jgi:hypothetical protein